MIKIVIGLAAAAVIAVAGYFGFTFYAQHRATAEVEAAFEQMRNSGAKASHGNVTYDPWKHALTIADVTIETATTLPVIVKVATLTASGIGQPEAGRMSADAVDASDIETSVTLTTGGTQLHYVYKLPKLTVTDCLIPTVRPASDAGPSYRDAIAMFTRTAASSVTVPELHVSLAMKLNAAVQTDGDITYSNLRIENLKDGKVANAGVERGTIAYTNQVAGQSQSFSGTFDKLSFDGIDFGAMAAMFDPQASSDDTFHQIHKRISVDNYDLKAAPGVHLVLGHIVMEDAAIQPSRMQLPALIAALPKGGTPPSPAQAQEMLAKLAGLYEGLRLGNFEIRDIAIDTPQGPAKLAAFHMSMDRGKADFGVDGVDLHTPQGPFKAGHFAIKGIDLVKAMRLSATIAPGAKPPAEQALALFQLVQGAEVKDLLAPSKDPNRPVNIETLNINWGQFIGPIPTQVHLIAKGDAPVPTDDPKVRPLLAAGIQSVKLDADLGLAWTEASSSLSLQPATVEMAGLGKAQARFALTNVPRTLFADPGQGVNLMPQINAGALEFTLHDLGVVDVFIRQYGSTRNLSGDAARAAVLEAIKTEGAQATNANPDASAAITAISHFVETPQQTLTIKLTPIGPLRAVQLFQLLKTEPLTALAQFKIEASTGP